eukprot:4283512-Amphidinium_carterae.1
MGNKRTRQDAQGFMFNQTEKNKGAKSMKPDVSLFQRFSRGLRGISVDNQLGLGCRIEFVRSGAVGYAWSLLWRG